MLLVFLGLVFLAMFIGGIGEIKHSRHDDNDGWWALTILGGLFLFILLLVWGGWYLSNFMGIQKWQAFRDYNVQNYAVTVEQTKDILSEEAFQNVLVQGSLEKTQVGAEISKRIAEWRDAVNKYNLTLASMRAVRANWLLGPLIMPEIPAGLTPLVINK